MHTERAEIVAFGIGFCTLQGSETASGPASAPLRQAAKILFASGFARFKEALQPPDLRPEASRLRQNRRFLHRFCTLAHLVTPSGPTSRPRRNRRAPRWIPAPPSEYEFRIHIGDGPEPPVYPEGNATLVRRRTLAQMKIFHLGARRPTFPYPYLILLSI